MYLSQSRSPVRSRGSASTDQSSCQRWNLIAGREGLSFPAASSSAATAGELNPAATRRPIVAMITPAQRQPFAVSHVTSCSRLPRRVDVLADQLSGETYESDDWRRRGTELSRL